MIRKLFLTIVAFTTVHAIPANAAYLVGGASGTLRVLITSGFYDLDGSRDSDGLPPTSVAGQLGTLRFSARIFADVPRDYPPYGNFTPFYINSFRLTLDDVTLSRHEFRFSDSNYEPEPGTTYHYTRSSGDDQTGYLSTYYGDNGSSTFYYDLLYQNNGRSGSGVIEEGDEGFGVTDFVDINYTVLGGRVFAAVPEPTSWALLIGGFGIVGGSLRVRRGWRARVFA